MAVSLGFGILFATLITLIIIPVNYLIFHRIGLWWNDKPSDISRSAVAHQAG
jgi:uncharacterized membrane protein YdfJ with MMPL/SSD domain